MKNVEYPEDSKDHQTAAVHAAARVLLVDTAENEGVDFLQALKQREMKFIFEGVSGHGIKCLINDVSCVVDIGRVAEVIKVRYVTPIPGAVSWIEGVMNFRGSLTRILFQLPGSNSHRSVAR